MCCELCVAMRVMARRLLCSRTTGDTLAAHRFRCLPRDQESGPVRQRGGRLSRRPKSATVPVRERTKVGAKVRGTENMNPAFSFESMATI